jgi:hypothetical protein
LKITGGWFKNIFGEDSEIGNRVARYGYKVAFEPKSIVYSDVPDRIMGVIQQRARWGVDSVSPGEGIAGLPENYGPLDHFFFSGK